MICKKCGSYNPEDVKFCTQCGAPVEPEQPAPAAQQSMPMYQQAPEYGQAAQTYQQAPEYGQTAQTYQQTPEYGQTAQTYQQTSTSYQQPLSGFTQGTATVPKKKSKTWLLVLLAVFCGVFLLLTVTEFSLLVEAYEENDELTWKNGRLEDSLEEAETELEYREDELRFYETFAAIVPDDGGYRYHVYGCTEYDAEESFWIYNVDLAEGKGYYACPYCH